MGADQAELNDAEKIILDLFGQDAQEGDCLWSGTMAVGFARAHSLGISMDDYKKAEEFLVRGEYLEKIDDNSFRLAQKGLLAKASGKRPPGKPEPADLSIIEDLS